MGRLEQKVALISGGARGQGATEARLFAAEGAKVVLGDVLDDAASRLQNTFAALAEKPLTSISTSPRKRIGSKRSLLPSRTTTGWTSS